MAKDTITLWVTEHDDPEVGYVVNARSDMEENFDDNIDAENEEPIAISVAGEVRHYDASRIFRLGDPATWEIEFGLYCDSWTEVEMPMELYLSSDRDAIRRWIDQAVGAE